MSVFVISFEFGRGEAGFAGDEDEDDIWHGVFGIVDVFGFLMYGWVVLNT